MLWPGPPMTISSPTLTQRRARARNTSKTASPISLGVRPQPIVGTFLPDHLGWWAVGRHPGAWCRVAAGEPGPEILTSPQIAGSAARQAPDQLCLTVGARRLLPTDLSRRLASRSPLLRLSTPTVWEAAATAVIRQVVHRNQARVVFDRVCDAFGPTVVLDGRPRYGFPTPESIVGAGEARLRETGMGFKATTLRNLAEWSIGRDRSARGTTLYGELIGVRGIGTWTASITMMDSFSDFEYYPVEDLAVRAHARAMWPERRWPAKPKEFADAWRTATAPHTAVITAFVLADAVLSAQAATVL